jgi:hypothetical protein
MINDIMNYITNPIMYIYITLLLPSCIKLMLLHVVTYCYITRSGHLNFMVNDPYTNYIPLSH